MSETITLPLKMDKRELFLRKDKIEASKEKLELFLQDEDKMHSPSFAKKVLLSNEVQSNNSVEGYYDDIEKIRDIVKRKRQYKDSSEEDKLRILNLYSGYKFVSLGKSISSDSLRKLYDILSNGLISEEELKNMGEYYRTNPVYIFYTSNASKEPDSGINASDIELKMNELLDFMKNYSFGNSLTDEYIKSQILHFYFVYIHPYYDVNGRTARTTSIWHLLNNKAYPYVIFNRGIQINKNEYYKVIREAKRYSNITYFLNYMMQTVLVELEKEHTMQSIAEASNEKLSALDYQTLHYLLSMKGDTTVSSFANMYNRHNEKKKPMIIHDEMLVPLIEKKIIIPSRMTKGHICKDANNYEMLLNKKYVDDDPLKIEHISILKKGN